MITKDAGATLSASVLAVVIAFLHGAEYAFADDFAQTERIEQYEEKIERLAEEAVQTGNVTTLEILERLGDRWIDKYDNIEHFETSERIMHAYLSRNLNASSWNAQNALNHLKIQNFETITNSVGSGHEITLLAAEYEKLLGIYEPSDPVRRYHDWLALQYNTPESQKEIQTRLVKLIGDEKFLSLAFNHAASFNRLAENGNVPIELFSSDEDYWIFTSNISVCSHRQDCDVEALKHTPQTSSQDMAELERQLGFSPVSFNLWDYILPQAYAVWVEMYVNYHLFGYIQASECYYDNCYVEWSDESNVGPSEIDVDSYYGRGYNLEHAERGAYLTFYGSACDTYTGNETVINRIEVTPYLGQTLRTDLAEYDLSVGPCATATIAGTTDSPWILGINIQSDGSFYWVRN